MTSIEEGIRLRDARIKKHLSQKLLAGRLGVSRPYVTKMENGDKPLNIKALEFIREVEAIKNPYPSIGKSKNGKKVTKSLNGINNLQGQNSENAIVSGFEDIHDTKSFEKWWWDGTNSLCKRCKKSCKQSDKEIVVYCPQFEAIERAGNNNEEIS
jgi:transcriptional regulator with XRE-family HTH domain